MRHRLDIGLGYGGIPGLLPENTVIAACNKANYRYYHDWQELTREQQGVIVAEYYMEQAIEGHKNAAINELIEKNKRKSKNPGRRK